MSAVSDALGLEIIRPLMRREYDQLVELGVFEGEPIELIEGRLVVMSPEGAPHTAVITRLARLLILALGEQAWVRVGSPLAVSDRSEPEPDLSVVAEISATAHPETAWLTIEVSHSSLRKDSVIKPGLYAAAGVPEYWIVDLNSDGVIVLTEPTATGYAKQERRGRGDSITLLAFPDVTLSIDDFLTS